MTRNTSIEEAAATPAGVVSVPPGIRGWRRAQPPSAGCRYAQPPSAGCRYAQPPANGWYPSGMTRCAQAGTLAAINLWCDCTAQAGGLEAISRWSRSVATTPPVSNGNRDRIPEGCQLKMTLAARVDEHLKKMGAVWK